MSENPMIPWIRRLVLSWLFAVLVEYLCLTPQWRGLEDLQGLSQMSFPRMISITAAGTLLLTFFSACTSMAKAERWGMVAASATLAGISLNASFSLGFLGACGVFLGVLAVYGIRGWNDAPEICTVQAPGKRIHGIITAVLAVVLFLFICSWTVGRVYAFRTPTYDFGIFSQMFYNMVKTGLPMTTLERDGLLSHFAVHVSPIYYLMLPFYWLFPCPAMLQVMQAAVIVSAVIPLWKLGGHRGLSGFQRMLLCAVLLLYPAYTGGTSYDLHENCFLTPLILWLFYGIDRKNGIITAVSALLTLMVKEDAAVYIAVIGLYFIVRSILYVGESRNLAVGVVLLAVSLVWFAMVTGYLAEQGDGVMTYRYSNFMYDGSSSLLTVIKAVLMNPMKAVYECVDPEKLGYLATTLLPILCLPLLTRRYERYLLLIPYVLVNLMSDYPYQHSIWFQYNFGSIAFLMYLMLINLSEWKLDRLRSIALVTSTLICVICFCVVIVPTAMGYPAEAIQNNGQFQEIRNVLSEIPEDASVSATTFYTTCLSQREVLYDVGYASRTHLLESEYVVLDLTRAGPYTKYATLGLENGLENLIVLLERNGYRLIAEIQDTLAVYQK